MKTLDKPNTLKSLNVHYLSGIIDGKIAEYNEINTIPADLELRYNVEFEMDGDSPKEAAKITFSWNSGDVLKEDETDFAENKRDDDYFTIVEGERIIKLQMYVEEILDRLTK